MTEDKKYYNATQPRARSKNQAVGTPDDYLTVVRNEFTIVHDLAANAENYVHPSYYSVENNAFDHDWHRHPLLSLPNTWLWLNPEFANIKPWARKCYEEMEQGARILMLVPASVGSTWFAEWVENKAVVRFNLGRLTFKGNTKPYPKDTMLCLYNKHMTPSMGTWAWKEILKEIS